VRTLFCRAVFVLAVAAIPRVLEAQTREFLDAPVVKSQIRVQWNADVKKITYAVDDDKVFRELPAGKLFLTKGSVSITYWHINPLRNQATAAITAADDPAHADNREAARSHHERRNKPSRRQWRAVDCEEDNTSLTHPRQSWRNAGPCGGADTHCRPDSARCGDAAKPATIRENVDKWTGGHRAAYDVSPHLTASPRSTPASGSMAGS